MQPDLALLWYILQNCCDDVTAGANPSVLLKVLIGAIIALALILYLHFQFGMWLPLEIIS
jgi:rod shape determining protein RodA